METFNEKSPAFSWTNADTNERAVILDAMLSHSCRWKHNKPIEITPLQVKTMQLFAYGTARVLTVAATAVVVDDFCCIHT